MRWLNASHVMNKGLWQRAIDDKLLGYVFARAHGVPTPSVLFCDPRGPPALPASQLPGSCATVAGCACLSVNDTSDCSRSTKGEVHPEGQHATTQ